MSDINSRIDLINYTIQEKHYRSYLEIGVATGWCFNQINVELKESVDPGSEATATYSVTSDKFFETFTDTKQYDLIFIDGLHRGEQVVRDIVGSLRMLTPGGFLVLHDCCPYDFVTARRYQIPQDIEDGEVFGDKYSFWMGDVWTGWSTYRLSSRYKTYTIDIDCGLGIVNTGKKKEVVNEPLPQNVEAFIGACPEPRFLSYELLSDYRESLLGLVDVNYFLNDLETEGDRA